jgi:hypothetical protein
MSQAWKDQRECLRYGGVWQDGRCLKQNQQRAGIRADSESATHNPAQRQAAVQESVDAAAEASRAAWLVTEAKAAYLLAEARPTSNGVGQMRFDGLLLIDRATKVREMAAAWIAAAEAWEAAERKANHP